LGARENDENGESVAAPTPRLEARPRAEATQRDETALNNDGVSNAKDVTLEKEEDGGESKEEQVEEDEQGSVHGDSQVDSAHIDDDDFIKAYPRNTLLSNMGKNVGTVDDEILVIGDNENFSSWDKEDDVLISALGDQRPYNLKRLKESLEKTSFLDGKVKETKNSVLEAILLLVKANEESNAGALNGQLDTIISAVEHYASTTADVSAFIMRSNEDLKMTVGIFQYTLEGMRKQMRISRCK
jgi:hypothetical protein